ncbi:hypothetical protein BsWGS_04171 [Bradybaena similaris]
MTVTVHRKLAKFILVLIPLFGIMYVLMYVAVPSNFDESGFNVAYLYLEMGYNSFQGFLLALLFCFLNEEVHGELKRLWLRYRSRRHEMSSIKSYYFQSPSHRNHSTSSKPDGQSTKRTSYDHDDRLVQNKLRQQRTVSIDRLCGPNSVTDRLKLSRKSLSSESLVQTPPSYSAVDNVFSYHASIDQSDSLLRRAVYKDAQQRIKRQSTTESTTSQTLPVTCVDYPGNVCLGGSESCGHTRI